MMRAVGLAIALAIVISQPVAADVIIPGPPLVPMDVSRAEAAKMAKSARTSVASIFDFSLPQRPRISTRPIAPRASETSTA